MPVLPASRGIKKEWLWALGVIAAIGAVVALRSLTKLFRQLFFGLLLAAAALPLSKLIEKRLPRAWASALAVIALTTGALGFVALFVPPLISQVKLIILEAPRLIEQLQALWQRLAQKEWVKALGLSEPQAGPWLAQLTAWPGQNLPGLIAGIGEGADAISRAFLSPILAYYFLRDREIFSYRLSLWIPIRHRKRALAALQEMRREAGGYARGQLLVALSVAALTAAGLLLVGLPAWLVLGLLMGACELIPYVGPIIGGVPIAIFSLPMGLSALIWSLGVTIAVQQIEGYFLSPRLMAGATGLHPVYVLILLSAGGLLWGLPGMILALPAFVCLRGAARVLYETRNSPEKL